MEKQNKTTVRNNNRSEYNKLYYAKKTWFTIRRGLASMRYSVFRRIVMIVGIVIAITLWIYQDRLFPDSTLFSDAFQHILVLCMSLGVVLITVALLGNTFQCGNTEHNFDRIGLTNKLGEPPILFSYVNGRKDKNPKETFVYYSNGVPLEKWMDSKGSIETALDRDITGIEYHKGNKRLVLITTAPKGAFLSDDLPMDDSLISQADFELLVGKGLTETITVNLNSEPHILVGGSTGSGKTVLVKNMAYQSISKGAVVIIGDFKGGVDFPEFFESANVITDKDEFNRLLKGLVKLLNERKRKFAGVGCANITEYNAQTAATERRIVVVCDELAQITDKTGLSKPEKELADSIIASLSIIARLGRAFGINLVLGTQRPDATIVPGQIKNNCDYRLCGFSPDSVLAEIILDNSAAVDVVKTNMTRKIPGRFVDNRGVLFQGYYARMQR